MVLPGGKGGSSDGNAVLSEHMKWPKYQGIVYVPLVAHASLSQQARNAIQAAINDYAAYTCIRFVQRTNQAHFVTFFRGKGCYSNVGYFKQANQPISIGDGCEYKGIAAHEMMHAIGFNHEQSRPDRDNYVVVQFQNVQQGMEHNFAKCQDCTTQYLPYDYASVMHYGPNYFTKNGQNTLLPRQAGVKIGQRLGLTQMDVNKINRLYGCQ